MPSDSDSASDGAADPPEFLEAFEEEMASSSTSVMGDSPPYVSAEVPLTLLTSELYGGPLWGVEGPGRSDSMPDLPGDDSSLSSPAESLLSSTDSDSSSSSSPSSVIVSSDG